MNPRLRAVCDLMVPTIRDQAGRHEYDGAVQDFSPAGIRSLLARLGAGERLVDPHDEAHLSAFEDHLRVVYGDTELHRRNPLIHIENLDLSCYDRGYAPPEARATAKLRQLESWPAAVDAAIDSLDQVSSPVADALLDTAKGLASAIPDDTGEIGDAARSAHQRLVAHLESCAARGDPSVALGEAQLARLMGAAEAISVDLNRLAEQAEAERDRLAAMLEDACRRIDPHRPADDVVRHLMLDHPEPDGILADVRAVTREVIEFTRERNLVPYLDGQCLVGLAPEARRWAMAMMWWAAPGEDEGPSWYHVTPPDPSWPHQDVEGWLGAFSHTLLPAVTAHEVAPGHFAHARALRRAPTAVRRVLHSRAFAEGWAHYGEELCMEEGFRADDPRFTIGVCVEGLVRVTRLTCAIGVHTGSMTIDDAARRFADDTPFAGKAAIYEARRSAFDPTYGCYTWGKLAIRDLRERARSKWGRAYSHLRFHTAMLDLGSPPLGLLRTALERG